METQAQKVNLSRRGFLGGLLATGVAAPAIVSVANIMPVRKVLELPSAPITGFVDEFRVSDITRLDVLFGHLHVQPGWLITLGFDPPKNRLLTQNEILREAMHLFKNSNEFLETITQSWDDVFQANDGVKIGTQLRIRLPDGYTVLPEAKL